MRTTAEPRLRAATLAAALLAAAFSTGEARAGRADVGGYLRVGTRPDFQGGDGRLGYWNLYGRLLNEGPYAMLDLSVDVLERQPLRPAPWTSLHFRVEGGSIQGADGGNGGLANLRLSRAYVQAGNTLLDHVTWQVGTLDTYMGDLGLYDMRPAEIFYGTVGLSGLYDQGPVQLLLGFGDSGWYLRRNAYDTVLTPGGLLRLRAGGHLEVGGGGMVRYEPRVPGNRFAPHVTPGVDYEDWVRGQVVERYLEENPNREAEFPDPVATDAMSWKAVGYLGFGDLGPLRWNNLFVSYELKHPDNFTTETYQGETYTIYVEGLTDERTVLTVGNEMQLTLWPGRLDAVWGALYGDHRDGDNDIVPTDDDRTYASTVLRLQAYMSDTVHWLVESSVAREHSRNGNAYREHADSIFANTGGLPDTLGLEYGDTDTRNTWQGKTGIVLNPLGPGVYVRPSLRLLYGVQYSNQNNAFGNSFVEDIDQYNEFGNIEQHWHHVLALETEAWF